MKSYPGKIRFVKEEKKNAKSLIVPTFLRSQTENKIIIIDALSKLIVYCSAYECH